MRGLKRLRVLAIVLAVASPLFLPGRTEAFRHLGANVRWIVPTYAGGYALLWAGTLLMAAAVGRHGPVQFVRAVQAHDPFPGAGTPTFRAGFVTSIVGPAVMVATEMVGTAVSLPAQAWPLIAVSACANIVVVVWFRVAIMRAARRGVEDGGLLPESQEARAQPSGFAAP